MNNKTVSERLKYLRSINKKTQKEFAEFLGIPQPSMSAYENGKNNPTIDVLIDIADKCKVSLDWLAGRSDYTFGLSSMRDFVLFMYELAMKKEIVTGAEALMRSLKAENVEVIFGYPGGAIMPVFDALFDYTRGAQKAFHLSLITLSAVMLKII